MPQYFARGVVGPLLLAWWSLWFTGSPAPAADPPPAERYQLTEDWSVAAQGPVHLREKRVIATYELEVSEISAADRRLRLRIADVAVDAEIPAQRRSGRFDSRQPPEKLAIDDHELMRPLAAWQQTFELIYTPEGSLQRVAGADAAQRRLELLYDEHLRGSEQDLYTRAFERELLSAETLRQAWAGLFLMSASELPAAGTPRELDAEATLIACIPSESWMTTVKLPVKETVSAAPEPEGTVTITRSAVLAPTDAVETTIGDAVWSYAPRSAERTVSMRVRPDGRVVSLNSSAKAVLQTTLSLGNDVPITMTIEQARTLVRR